VPPAPVPLGPPALLEPPTPPELAPPAPPAPAPAVPPPPDFPPVDDPGADPDCLHDTANTASKEMRAVRRIDKKFPAFTKMIPGPGRRDFNRLGIKAGTLPKIRQPGPS
jgi:hypothetical protein